MPKLRPSGKTTSVRLAREGVILRGLEHFRVAHALDPRDGIIFPNRADPAHGLRDQDKR
jgi:hypothetical protein